MPEPNELPLEVDVQTVAAMRDRGDDFLLLDVREPSEYETAKIDGAQLLPMSELRERVGEIENHRDKPIIVHCHHGGRSMQVTQALRQHGFQKVQNMAGGIDQWSLDVDQNVPRY